MVVPGPRGPPPPAPSPLRGAGKDTRGLEPLHSFPVYHGPCGKLSRLNPSGPSGGLDRFPGPWWVPPRSAWRFRALTSSWEVSRMNRILINLLLTEDEAMLLSYGLRNPAQLLEGVATNPDVLRKARKIARRLDEALVPWDPETQESDIEGDPD